MSAKHIIVATVLAGLWVGNVAAQVTSPSASPSTGAAPAKPGVSSTGPKAADGTTDPNAVEPTSDVGNTGPNGIGRPLYGTPSTGSEASSPGPIPGSPPTATR